MLSTVLASSAVLADSDHGPGDWWPIFPIFWVLFFVLIAFLISRRIRHCGPGTDSGVARLAERFAAGEIDEAEYRSRLAVLNEQRR